MRGEQLLTDRERNQWFVRIRCDLQTFDNGSDRIVGEPSEVSDGHVPFGAFATAAAAAFNRVASVQLKCRKVFQIFHSHQHWFLLGRFPSTNFVREKVLGTGTAVGTIFFYSFDFRQVLLHTGTALRTGFLRIISVTLVFVKFLRVNSLLSYKLAMFEHMTILKLNPHSTTDDDSHFGIRQFSATQEDL